MVLHCLWSDAVAGVVNFILDDFTGFKAGATNSFYVHENDNSKLKRFMTSIVVKLHLR